MSNQWLRLWHDMPTDPKWRTISRLSGQSISLVIAVYMHLLVDASRNVTRGHVSVTTEDLASSLDVTDDQISSILGAMQGRVISESRLTGWELRQPKREDSGDETTGAKSAAERKREQRERAKAALNSGNVTTGHDASQNVTLDKEKIKSREEEISNTEEVKGVVTPTSRPRHPAKPKPPEVPKPDGVDQQTWDDLIQVRKAKKAAVTQTMVNSAISEAAKANLTLEQFMQIWCRRGSQSLEASWLKPNEIGQFRNQQNQSKYAGAAAVMYGEPNQGDFIDA